MGRKKAFTLIELLVVVAIIALLIAILLPSLGRARETSRKSVCAANLHAQGLGFALYASENGDRLPTYPPANSPDQWALIDVDSRITDTMMSAASAASIGQMKEGSARRLFYCPSNTVVNGNDNYWKGFGANDKRIIGYNLMIDRGSNATLGFFRGLINNAKTGNNVKRTAPPFQPATRFAATPFPSQSELMFDTIFTAGTTAPGNTMYVSGVSGGGGPLATSHMRGSIAAGMNTLCFDGHVEWRDYSTNPDANLIMKNANNLTTYIVNPK